jgi:hypothetical protein
LSEFSTQPDWRVIHNNLDGIKLAEVAPEQLSWGRYLNRPGYINYDIDLSAFAGQFRNVGAYRTDFDLKRDDLTILSGLHTAVSADMDTNVVSIAGYGWMHYLERRTWPFSMGSDHGNDGQIWTDEDIGSIVSDLVYAASVNGKGVDFIVTTVQLGITTNYRIEPADSETLFDKITTLSQQNPGFDFVVDNNKNFLMYVPEKGKKILNYSLELGRNVKSIHYGDNGPVANAVLATGAGSSTKIGFGVEDIGSEQTYRRHDQVVDYGDNPSIGGVTGFGLHQLEKSATPNLDIWVSVYPEEFDNAYTSIDVGDSVKIIAEMDYVQVNDFYRVTGIEGYLNNQGDEQIVFTFNDKNDSNA